MKTRLSLTIDDELITSIKNFAQKQGVSISEIVETHFRQIVKLKRKKKNILHLVEDLKAHAIDPQADLKDLFYQEQSSKYGF